MIDYDLNDQLRTMPAPQHAAPHVAPRFPVFYHRCAACTGFNSDAWVETLAHELKNPLNALLLTLDELRPACAAQPDAQQAYNTAAHVALQMAKVIEEVLDICRAKHGKLFLRTEPVDVGEIVRATVRSVHPLIAQRGQRIAVLISPDLPPLQAQASRLEQVFTNLLVNATKFTGKNGAISITVKQTDAAISIRVCDSGIGISPELLPQIFHAYQQGPLARLGRQGGLGIGLALVKSIVELHGGSVTAKSEGPGMGSEFIVNLPLTVQTGDALPSQFIDDA